MADEVTKNSKKNITDTLRIITGIHFSKSMLKALNGITFIYNPNWDIREQAFATLPVSFFGIKSIHEVMESEISQKPMLFYNDTDSDNPAVTNSSKLAVVADNILIKPKQYRMEIIIPYSNLTLLNGNSYVLSSTQFSAVMSHLTGGEDVIANIESTINNFEGSSWLYSVVPYMDIIKTLCNSLFLTDYTTLSSSLRSVFEVPDYNKNSLEAMWQSRSILKLKLWNGWRYKYVAITNLDVTKEGTEDGVYEATLTVQEVPILTLRNDKQTEGYKQRTFSNLLMQAARVAVETLDNAEVKEE